MTCEHANGYLMKYIVHLVNIWYFNISPFYFLYLCIFNTFNYQSNKIKHNIYFCDDKVKNKNYHWLTSKWNNNFFHAMVNFWWIWICTLPSAILMAIKIWDPIYPMVCNVVSRPHIISNKHTCLIKLILIRFVFICFSWLVSNFVLFWSNANVSFHAH